MADEDVKGVSQYRGGWRAYLTIPGRSPMTPTFATKAEAVDWKRAADEAKGKRLPIPKPVSPTSSNQGQYQTFEGASEAWLDHRRRNRGPEEGFSGIESAERSLANHILPSLGRMAVSSVSPADVESFRDQLASKGLAVSYQRYMLGVIKRIFAFAKSRSWVTQDPSHDVRPTKPAGSRRRPFTIENCFQKGTAVTWDLALALAFLIRPRFRVGFWIQIILGLRIGELFGLSLTDWYPEQRILLVHAQAGAQYATGEPGVQPYRIESTKTIAGTRALIVPEVLAEAIDQHIAEWHAGSPSTTPLIVNPLGGKRYCTYASEVTKSLRHHNILNERGKPATSHYLRHLTITNFMNAKIDGRVISQLVGHDTAVAGAANITMNYDLGASAEEVQSEVGKLADQLHLAGLTDLNPAPARADEYMTRLDAAVTLARSEETLQRWQHEGRLSKVLLPLSAGGRCVALVPRVEVEALLEARADRWTMPDVVENLKMERTSVVLAARLAGIPRHRSTDESRSWFTCDDFDRLVTEVEAWRSFRAEHVTVEEAAGMLHTSSLKIRRMTKSRGGLKTVERPLIVLGVSGNAVWIRSSDIDKIALLPRETWLGGDVDPHVAEGLLTVDHAAQRLGCSAETVRKLIRTGELQVLPIEGARRYWISPDSVRGYAESIVNR